MYIDNKIIALAQHLDLSVEDMFDIEHIKHNKYRYNSNDYLVCTDDEADKEEYEYLKDLINTCYLSQIDKGIRNLIETYLDITEWIEDWSDKRGENLNSYDNIEYEEEIDDETYYIYRQ